VSVDAAGEGLLLRLPHFTHAAATEAAHQLVVTQHATFDEAPRTRRDRSFLVASAK